MILLFDLDGTLTNPKEGITKCVAYALETVCGIHTENLDTLTPYIGPPLMEGFQEHHHLDRTTAARCQDAYRARFSKIGLFENTVFPDIPQVLETLHKQGHTLCVATSKPETFAVQILQHFSLAHYFTQIVGATLDGTVSTKEDVIAQALARLQHPPHHTVLMIGDRKYDILGAHQFGIRAIGVLFGFGSQAELEDAGADVIVAQASQLPKTIEQLSR